MMNVGNAKKSIFPETGDVLETTINETDVVGINDVRIQKPAAIKTYPLGGNSLSYLKGLYNLLFMDSSPKEYAKNIAEKAKDALGYVAAIFRN